MSKRKDRLFTDYRYCPKCGIKGIGITKYRKLFHKELWIECYKGHTTKIKE